MIDLLPDSMSRRLEAYYSRREDCESCKNGHLRQLYGYYDSQGRWVCRECKREWKLRNAMSAENGYKGYKIHYKPSSKSSKSGRQMIAAEVKRDGHVVLNIPPRESKQSTLRLAKRMIDEKIEGVDSINRFLTMKLV